MKLTKRVVDNSEPREKPYFIWDGELRGFGCCVHPTGRKAYVVRFVTTDRRDRRMVLGTHGALTVQQARSLAQEHLGAAATGRDPAQERQEKRRGDTVADLGERYLNEYAFRKKSVEEDRRKLEKDVTPRLGRLKVRDVGMADVSKLHAAMADRPVAANRVLALLSKMFKLSEQWGMRPLGSNPVQHIQKYKETARERYLTDEELQKFGAALEAVAKERPNSLAAVNALHRHRSHAS